MPRARGRGRGRTFGGLLVPWTPAQGLGANGIWLPAALLTKNTQPSINGDFETDISGWNAISGGVLSRVADTRTGGSGSWVLDTEVVAPDVDAGASEASAPHIAGNRYTFNGWAKGDGVVRPRVGWGGWNDIWTGTSSSSWQQISEEYTAGSSGLIVSANGAGGHTRWDDLVLTNLSVTQADPQAATGTLAGSALVQAADASMGWESSTLINSLPTLEFDGTADHYVSDAAASAWGLHKGGSIAFVCHPDSGGAGTDTVIDTCDGNASNHGITIDYDLAAETIHVLVANGTGTFVVNDTHALSKGAAHEVEVNVEASGYSINVDGGTATTGALTGSLSSSDATATMQVGRKSGGSDFWQGLIAELWLRVGADSAALARVGADMRSRYGL